MSVEIPFVVVPFKRLDVLHLGPSRVHSSSDRTQRTEPREVSNRPGRERQKKQGDIVNIPTELNFSLLK